MISAVLADDEPVIVRGLKKILDWQQLQVALVGEAYDGARAAEIILQQRPHLLISDICMPHQTGIDLLRMIKQNNLPTKVILLSCYQDFNYAREAIALGALDYIVKPVDGIVLEQAVKRAVTMIAHELDEEELRDRLTSYESSNQAAPQTAQPEPDDIFKLPICNSDINRVREYVNNNYSNNINLQNASNVACMNPSYFSYYFKKHTGMNFKDYLLKVRLGNAMKLLRSTNLLTYEIAERVGFNDAKLFSEKFKDYYGNNPMKYKKDVLKIN